jgi:hypothetical protein
MSPPREGGCPCGAIRYRVHTEPVDVGYCHCAMCRASGGPGVALATVPVGALEWLRGEPALERCSPFGERGYCRDCGALLIMRVDHQPDMMDFTIATLDQSDATPPDAYLSRGVKPAGSRIADRSPRGGRQLSWIGRIGTALTASPSSRPRAMGAGRN